MRFQAMPEFGKLLVETMERVRVSSLHRRPEAGNLHSPGNSAQVGIRRHAVLSLSASAVVVARRRAAHASKSDLR